MKIESYIKNVINVLGKDSWSNAGGGSVGGGGGSSAPKGWDGGGNF